MILIISHEKDTHASSVIRQLELKNEKYFLLDLADFPQSMGLSMEYYGKEYTAYLRSTKTDNALELSDINSVWWRRPQPFKLHENIKSVDHVRFAYNEAEEAFRGYGKIQMLCG